MEGREPEGLVLALTKLEKNPGVVRMGRRVTMEFHISKKIRDEYEFDEGLFSITGNVILPNFHASRILAKKINDQRDTVRFPELAVRSGEINAMGLIDEILHYVLDLYREDEDLHIFDEAISFIEGAIGKEEMDAALTAFTEHFPPLAVYKGEISVEDYLAGETEGVSHREMTLEEMLMLWIANKNPAFEPFRFMFNDSYMKISTKYTEIMDQLYTFFETKPQFGPENQHIMDMLRAPAIECPDSLEGQLAYMRDKWGMLLGKYLLRLLSSIDMIKEENKMRGHVGGGDKETFVLEYGGDGGFDEPEKYSPDKDWMPKVVLLAKSALVWLDQLSKKYKREIKTLDQIPQEEVDILASQGFNSLWLIGLWERSQASKTIKQWCGNPEAEASAYSLYDYEIAHELGGWEALGVLREKCIKRGIRLASDMVPNHTGLDSRWVINHPDWFLQLDYSPQPQYNFNTGNLCNDERVSVHLDEHYYTQSDCAVVFKRRDNWTGEERFIYHGNDGTHMPWNDTAQINFLHPEAREAVIQTILHVARNFPIIRFDAAMTLAKRHIQRLWFPRPGSGGDIPTRAEHGMTDEEFNKAIPEEFWREVVDRIAKEVPDTLLLAEAFWMMEGYFVRTLGMHRVYNSAFMNMLYKEENEKYRSTIKNTQEFDPEILKRFVNFMNNPDEETAVDQFGKGDKYFGICTMMITMPGLPMFGHGQIEGFHEKYGMEYRKAYWDETPDEHLIREHEHKIFPLMKKRYLFAEVHNFLLYDFYAPEGHVNENIFAYSNRTDTEKALVVYNNSHSRAMGWINTSAAFAVKKGEGKELQQRHLSQGLCIHNDERRFTLLKEHNSGLWYIRNSKELCEKGMYFDLHEYEYQVYIDIYEVVDNELGHYAQLAHELQGGGTPDVNESLKEIMLRPLYGSLDPVINTATFEKLLSLEKGADIKKALGELKEKLSVFLKDAKEFAGGMGDIDLVLDSIISSLEISITLPGSLKTAFKGSKSKELLDALAYVTAPMEEYKILHAMFLGWSFVKNLGGLISKTDISAQSASLIDEWLLDKRIVKAIEPMEFEFADYDRIRKSLKVMTAHQDWNTIKVKGKATSADYFEPFLKNQLVRSLIGENRYDNILWFNKEGYEDLIWLAFSALVVSIAENSDAVKDKVKAVTDAYKLIESWIEAEEKSGYKVEELLYAMGRKRPAPKKAKTSVKKAPAKKKGAVKK